MSPDGGGPAAHPDDRYATLFRQSVIPQLLVDLDGSVTEVNEAACALLGVAPTTLIGRDFAEEVLGERPSRGLPLLDAVASGDLEETRTVRRAAPVSQLGDWVSVAPLRGPSGEVWELAVVLLDRPRLQEALRTVEESGSGWRALLEDVNDATLITDQDLVADYVSPSFTAELGHRPADVLGTSLVDLVHPAEADRVRTAVRDFLESGTTRMELSFPMASAAGDWSEVDATVVDLLEDPEALPLFDYVVANGVFTQKVDNAFNDMWRYFTELVPAIFAKARRGIAFNVMSTQVDWQREDLFHLPFDALAAFLTSEVSRHFVVRHDYGLYEYTVYVYRRG